jgi:hypothetical protein
MFETCLPPNLHQRPLFDVFSRMWNGDQTGTFGVMKLMMASLRTFFDPAVLFQNPYDFCTGHFACLK